MILYSDYMHGCVCGFVKIVYVSRQKEKEHKDRLDKVNKETNATRSDTSFLLVF